VYIFICLRSVYIFIIFLRSVYISVMSNGCGEVPCVVHGHLEQCRYSTSAENTRGFIFGMMLRLCYSVTALYYILNYLHCLFCIEIIELGMVGEYTGYFIIICIGVMCLPDPYSRCFVSAHNSMVHPPIYK